MITNSQDQFVDTKPVVWLFLPSTTAVVNSKPIQLGLEEEGIPCELNKVSEDSAHNLAISAAKASSLGVGIGLVDSATEAVIHHRDLPDAQTLIEVTGEKFKWNLLRQLGANAARLVKGSPLLDMSDEEQEMYDAPLPIAPVPFFASTTYENIEALTKIVIEVINALDSNRKSS